MADLYGEWASSHQEVLHWTRGLASSVASELAVADGFQDVAFVAVALYFESR